MPYINGDARKRLDPNLDYLGIECPQTAGELNYLLTQIILDYSNAWQDSQPRYQTYNDVIGALECCKLEMYRRAVAPYEERKIAENGDVYL